MNPVQGQPFFEATARKIVAESTVPRDEPPLKNTGVVSTENLVQLAALAPFFRGPSVLARSKLIGGLIFGESVAEFIVGTAIVESVTPIHDAVTDIKDRLKMKIVKPPHEGPLIDLNFLSKSLGPRMTRWFGDDADLAQLGRYEEAQRTHATQAQLIELLKIVPDVLNLPRSLEKIELLRDVQEKLYQLSISRQKLTEFVVLSGALQGVIEEDLALMAGQPNPWQSAGLEAIANYAQLAQVGKIVPDKLIALIDP